MFRRTLRCLDLLALLAALLGAIGVAYFLSTYPIAFQKSISISDEPFIDPDWSIAKSLDAHQVIGSIPYHGSVGISDVLPRKLYERTILEGYGNCANKVRGLSYLLLQEGIPFERVDLVPADGFMQGKGHTIIRTKYELNGVTRVGIIDILEGGVPVHGDEPVDLLQLRESLPYTLKLKPLSVLVDDHSDYYGSFLETVDFGVVDHRDIARYFQFVEFIYIPLDNPTLERFLCNASAAVLGIFPKLHVSPEAYVRLTAQSRTPFVMAHILMWSVRIFLLSLIASTVLRCVRAIRGWLSPSLAVQEQVLQATDAAI